MNFISPTEDMLHPGGRIGEHHDVVWVDRLSGTTLIRSRFRNVNVHEFPHAGSEADGGTAVADFDLAPGRLARHDG
jgi:hypothetical protein